MDNKEPPFRAWYRPGVRWMELEICSSQGKQSIRLQRPHLTDGVYKHNSINIATGVTGNPSLLWSITNSGVTPCVLAPSGIQTDDFTLFWANKAQGTTNGVVCRGPATPPQINPLTANVADNEEGARGVALTARFLYYATQNGVFGMAKGKTYSGCANKGDCVKVGGGLSDPQGMVWDRDGTVYLADTGRPSSSGTTGMVLSFPSGSLAEHGFTEVIEAQGVHDVALLQVPSGENAASHLVVAFLLTLIA